MKMPEYLQKVKSEVDSFMEKLEREVVALEATLPGGGKF